MKKALAQSERARVRGLCKVSPPPVLVRRQPFIGPVGQGCRMAYQLHVNFNSLDSLNQVTVRPSESARHIPTQLHTSRCDIGRGCRLARPPRRAGLQFLAWLRQFCWAY